MHYYLSLLLVTFIVLLVVSLAIKFLPASVLFILLHKLIICIAFVLGMLTFFKIVEGILNTIDNILGL